MSRFVHVSHSKLMKLAKTINFTKKDVVSSLKILDESIIAGNSNFVPILQVECGPETSEVVKNLTEKQTLTSKKSAQDHYIPAYKHIVTVTPVSKDIWKYLIGFYPDDISSSHSSMYITTLGNLFPINVVTKVLLDEWQLLQVESEVSQLKDQRINHYWRQFFSKYPCLATLVKAYLSLSHGSADVELGFSLSGRLLADHRATMSSRMLDAKWTIL
ncbi:hypothetical protein PR048_025543 [Dryococelus australis]|uniref:HAT C-terminal dimerisation domain-containing protein n=1 Tax=Dryococelus australis TaxID=614101 RepID=A0ABQ9GRM3_9NEOP|nr:hypothetical protein PR048_025543 [Dryococelus australis]